MGIKKGGDKYGQVGSENTVTKQSKATAFDSDKEKNKKLSADEFFKIKDSKKKFTGPKATKNSLGDEINKFREMDTRINAKTGGRVNFRGGGMCKKGMNKKARGANS
jgi:hypothetical protein